MPLPVRSLLRALLAGVLLAGVPLAGGSLAAPLPAPLNGLVASAPTVYVVGAGDIASCGAQGDGQTAALLDRLPGTVFTAGDNAYEHGTRWEFNHCYGPTWGRHLGRTRPAVGNHEYGTDGGRAYFDYFGSAAGNRGRGWYAYQRGSWRIYVLNSNCAEVSGCWVGSPQERWLKADLAAHPQACVMAYWHHPRFSSGEHGSQVAVRGLWRTLYAADAEIVVNGHDHDYERFAPQDPNGAADPVRGIREFVVGTGGRSLRRLVTVLPNSQVSNATSYGVLNLALGDGWYRWRFVPVSGETFTDAGTGTCH